MDLLEHQCWRLIQRWTTFSTKNKFSKIIKTLIKLSFYDKLIISNLISMLTIFDLGSWIKNNIIFKVRLVNYHLLMWNNPKLIKIFQIWIINYQILF